MEGCRLDTNLLERKSITLTVLSMLSWVLPQSSDPSLDPLWSFPFCESCGACKSTITLMPCFLYLQMKCYVNIPILITIKRTICMITI